MASAQTNRNVRSADVFESTSGGGDTGARTLDAVVASGHMGARVIDLCRAVSLERATVHRLLATLRNSGYVVVQGRFRYVPGPRLGLRHQAHQMPTWPCGYSPCSNA